MGSSLTQHPGGQARSAATDATTGLPGYPPQVADEGFNPRMIWGILRRYWLVVLVVTLLAGLAGYLFTSRLTPIYEANASLRINDRESGIAGLEMLTDLRGGGSEVNTEMEVLRSRVLAEAITDEMQLRVGVREPRRLTRSEALSYIAVDAAVDSGEVTLTPTGRGFVAVFGDARAEGRAGDTITVGGVHLALSPRALKEQKIVLGINNLSSATTGTMKSLRVSRPSREANIIVLRYSNADPKLAMAVPNRLLEVFLERRSGTKRSGATSTVAFLRTQLDTLSQELRLAEDSLKNYRERNAVVSLQQQALVSVGKLAELQAERDAANAELQAIDSLVRRANSLASAEGVPTSFRRLLAFPTLLRNNSVSALLTSLTTLETERGSLLAKYTMKDPGVMALTAQIENLEGQVRAIVGTYSEGLRQQVDAYDRTMKASGVALNTIPAKEVAVARLMRNTTVLGELSTLLQTKLKEAEIAGAVDDPSAQIVDRAFNPESPIFPRTGLNLALSLMLGFMIGLGGVFARELLDTKIHSREDLQKMAPVPVLGVIPHFRQETGRVGGRLRRQALPSPEGGALATTSLAALANPAGAVLEAYRALRTNLAFALAERPPKIVVVTSPTPGDGKSTTTANLAASLAQQKLRVLVIDADMRRGALHRTLGGVRGPGLSEILTGRATVEGVVQTLSFGDIGRIDLISTGTVPPNPAELLSSSRLVDLLEVAEAMYDTILIDSPPVNNVTDALIIAPHADGLLLVARGNKTDRGAVRFAMEQLATVRAKVMGTILNEFDVRRAAAYGGYYRYYAGAGYSSTPEAEVADAA